MLGRSNFLHVQYTVIDEHDHLFVANITVIIIVMFALLYMHL